MFGEIFYVFLVDYFSLLQAYKKYVDGGDGCVDIFWKFDYNCLGCNFQECCVFMEC